MEEVNIKIPNVLIISSNPLSSTMNNGKTLASFFEKYPKEHLFQLYYYEWLPDIDIKSYFKISDQDMLKRFFHKKDHSGVVECVEPNNRNAIMTNRNSKGSKGNLKRLLREFLWLGNRWINNELDTWLDYVAPDVCFFVAGNCAFSHTICNYVCNKYSSSLFIYVTDDYFLKRHEFSPFFWLHRSWYTKKMKLSVNRCEQFFTISSKMQKEYIRLFGKESLMLVNLTDYTTNSGEVIEKSSCDDCLSLVYAGSLYYGREEIILKISEIIEKINLKSHYKIRFDIYTNNSMSKKAQQIMSHYNYSNIHNSVGANELKEILINCDIPVFVESFEKKNIEKVRLSFSTKIPEYLSLGKCILAVGPNNVSSIEYLLDCALCITDLSDINKSIYELINNKNKMLEYGALCKQKYKKLKNSVVNAEKLSTLIIQTRG